MTAIQSVLHRPVFLQFVKFIIIGATSATVDIVVNKLLLAQNLHWIPSAIIAFILAVTNGFIWNSLWTFRGLGNGSRKTMYVKFVLVNIVGLIIQLSTMKLVFIVLTGKLIYPGNPPDWMWNYAKALAIIVGAFWNFSANKFWTFRPVEVHLKQLPGVSSPQDEGSSH